MILTEYNEKKHMKKLFAEGREEGIREGREEGIRALIETCQELDISMAETQIKIEKRFDVSKEKSVEYIEKYWCDKMKE